jgi:hypothetical protein
LPSPSPSIVSAERPGFHLAFAAALALWPVI